MMRAIYLPETADFQPHNKCLLQKKKEDRNGLLCSGQPMN
jgi:hypothetical protein